MRKLFLFLLILFSFNLSSQTVDLQKIAQDITERGKLLYRLEIAAWYGSDIFNQSFNERERIGGYFSYLDNDTPKCLFFSKGENPKVLGVVSFGDIKIVETATIDFKERNFKNNEKDLYTIRTRALAEIQNDTLFKSYSNSNLNLIPLLDNEGGKVYVLTGTKKEGVVLFGNDYLLTFDKQDNLLAKEQLHRNLIPIYFGDQKDSEDAEISVHSHANSSSEFITPTDVCTLMLYAKYAGWKQHYVVSANYVSIWDCEKESLTIMTREDFLKYEEMQE